MAQVKARSSSSALGRRAAQAVVCGLRFFTPLRLSNTKPAPSPARQVALTQRAARSATTVLDGTSLLVAGRSVLRPLSVNHVALLVKDLDRSLAFFRDALGLELNPARPHSKLPYRGAWLWLGPEMIHLMELDSPDTLSGRPEAARGRHVCVSVSDIKPLVKKLEAAGIPFSLGKSGRDAIMFRDPDMNSIEVVVH